MKKLPPIVYLVIGFIFVWTIHTLLNISPDIQQSIGDRVLFTQNLSSELIQAKKEGAEAFDRQDYNLAIQKSD